MNSVAIDTVQDCCLRTIGKLGRSEEAARKTIIQKSLKNKTINQQFLSINQFSVKWNTRKHKKNKNILYKKRIKICYRKNRKTYYMKNVLKCVIEK